MYLIVSMQPSCQIVQCLQYLAPCNLYLSLLNSGGKKGEAGGVGGAAGDAGTITKKAVRRWSVHSSTAANTSS